MGRFIESLRQKMQQEYKNAQLHAQKEAEAVLKAGRKERLEREQILRERVENRPQWEEAKRQFNESGLLAVFKNVIDLKGAKSYYVDPENFDDMIHWNFDVGAPYFYAELHIERSIKEHDESYYVGGYSNKNTTKYIGIRTDKDGVISFYGKRHAFDRKGSRFAKLPKTKWQRDVGVLEDALGRVYSHPLISEKREMHDNPAFDRLFGIVDRSMNEYREPKD